MISGKFITFEGPDGSGKTTVSTYIAKTLQAQGYDVMHTREPGGIDIAEQIRDVILNPRNQAMDAKTEALLYAASRRQHYVEKVKPALEAGKIVLCDRFIDSSLAYQGVGRKLGIDEVYAINEFAIEGHLPDMTLYFDVPVEVGLSRLANRTNKDRLDQETLTFHNDVYLGYQQVLRRYPTRIQCVDATQDVEHVKQEALHLVLRYICHD